jgi:hypothetical protein
VPSKITHWVGVQSLQRYLLQGLINPRCGLICGLTATINPLSTLSLVLVLWVALVVLVACFPDGRGPLMLPNTAHLQPQHGVLINGFTLFQHHVESHTSAQMKAFPQWTQKLGTYPGAASVTFLSSSQEVGPFLYRRLSTTGTTASSDLQPSLAQ